MESQLRNIEMIIFDFSKKVEISVTDDRVDMLRILLVNPPFVMPVPARQLYPPLGLACLAACLERDGHIVAILDAHAEGVDDVSRRGEQCVVGLPDSDLCARIADF